MSLPIILLLGHAGVGKDLAGRCIVDEAGGTTIAFADKLKSICQEMFGLSREDCYTDAGKRRETVFERLGCHFCGGPVTYDAHEYGFSCVHHGVRDDVRRSFWTVREILQYIGTEGFRAVDKDVWVRYALREARRLLAGGQGMVPYNVVAITDGRFRSEFDAVRAVGGEVWRIRRPNHSGAVGLGATHQSEAEQDSIRDEECQAVIENDGTIEVFRERVLAELRSWRKRQENK